MIETIEVDRLDGGYSQQPARHRQPGQTESAQNVDCAVGDGTSKRPGSILVAVIADADPNSFSPNLSGTNYRLHTIERDNGERYIVVVGDSTIRIVSEAGVESTVSISATAEAYLDSGSADQDELRLRSYIDTTFLINSQVTPAAIASPAYDLKRVFPRPSDVFSFTAAPSATMRAESDDTADKAGYYRYTMNGQTSLTYGRWDGAILTNQWSQPYSGFWDLPANQPAGFRVAFARRRLTGITSADYNHTTRTITSTGNFAGVTVRSGDMVFITDWGTLTGSPTANAWFEIESGDDDDLVLSANQVNTLPTSTDTGQVDANDSDSKCRIGREIEVSFDFSVETITDMHDVAAAIERELRSANADNFCCAWISSPGGGGQFQLTGPYRGDGSATYQPTAPTVLSVTDLTAANAPFNSSGVTLTTGTGTLSTNPETTNPLSRWTKVAASEQLEAVPDGSTMPCAILRTSASNFSIDVVDWDTRKSGDELANPVPEFLANGVAITDLAVHRNRLAILAGAKLFLTQDGDIYNVYASDFANTIDSDPIEVPFDAESLSIGDFLVPFRNALQVFTLAGRQFDIGGGENRLTQETVQVNASTRFNTVSTRPAVSANLLYFVATLESASALMEYYYDDLSVSTRTENANIHTPDVIGSSPKTITTHPTTGRVFVLDEIGNTLHVYRTYFAQGQKRQSAWTTWVIDPLLTIIDIVVVGDRLYMLTTNLTGSSEYVLEYIPLGREDPISASWPYTAHLDRRITLTGSYVAGPNETTFDLGFLQAEGSTINSYVLGPDFSAPGTYSIDATAWTYTAAPAKTIVIPGDLSDGPVVLGRFFTTEGKISRPFRRGDGGVAKSGDRMTLIQIITDHIDAGEYDIIVTTPNANTHTTSFDAGAGAVEEAGHLKAYLRCNPDKSTIKFYDQSPRPLTIAGYQIEADVWDFAR